MYAYIKSSHRVLYYNFKILKSAKRKRREIWKEKSGGGQRELLILIRELVQLSRALNYMYTLL